jgi:hypothetical protein
LSALPSPPKKLGLVRGRSGIENGRREMFIGAEVAILKLIEDSFKG